MAKKKTAESDEARLKKKITAKMAGHTNPEGDAALRALRKKLKREQRKRRALALRRKHAGIGKSAETPAS